MSPEYTWKGKPLDAPKSHLVQFGRQTTPGTAIEPEYVCKLCDGTISSYSGDLYQIVDGSQPGRVHYFHGRCVHDAALFHALNRAEIGASFRLVRQQNALLWPAVGQVIAEYATRRELWIAQNKRFSAHIRNQRKALRQLEREKNDLLGWKEHAQAIEPELAETKRRLDLMTQARDSWAKAFQDAKQKIAESPATRFSFADQTTPFIAFNPVSVDERQALYKQIEDVRRQLAAQTSTVNSWKTGYEALGREVDRLRSDKRAMAGEVESLTHRLQAALTDAAGMKDKIDTLTGMYTAANNERNDLHRNLDVARDANRFAAQRIATLERTQAPIMAVPDPTAAYWKERAQVLGRDRDLFLRQRDQAEAERDEARRVLASIRDVLDDAEGERDDAANG